MKKRIHGAGACVLTLVMATGGALAAPANDTCNNRQTVIGGIVNFDTTGATSDINNASCGYYGELYDTIDVWYEYTAGFTGNAILHGSNCADLGSFQCSVYTACDGTEVACESELCINRMTLPVVQGTTYIVRVATYHEFGIDGPGTLVISEPPTNDTCNTAKAVGPGMHPFDTTLAHEDGGVSLCWPSQIQQPNTVDVWYEYTAVGTGVATFRTTNCGGSGSTNNIGGAAEISIFDVCGGASLACSANACQRPLFMPITPGRKYIVRVSSYYWSLGFQSGPATFEVAEGPALANDNCAGAQSVMMGNVYPWTTYGATTERVVQCATSTSHKTTNDVWYQFTAPADAIYEFSSTAIGSATYPGMSLHVSCAGPAIGCTVQQTNGVTRLTRLMDTGESVYIRLGMLFDSTAAEAVSGYLTIQDDQPRGYDTCGSPLDVHIGVNPFDITSVMADDGGATCDNNSGRDAYFRFTANKTGIHHIDTCGSVFATFLSVSSACGSGEIACNATTPNPSVCSTASLGSSALDVNLTAGQVVYIRVAGRNLGHRGYGQINITAPACAADFNDDGVRDVADLFAYINVWLAKTGNADFNDDSTVDVADLFAYINAWLAGC